MSEERAGAGRVVAIYQWPVKRGAAVALETAEAVAEVGLHGDQKRSRKRQVTLLDERDWNQAAREVGAGVDPMHRRANVVVTGISLLPTLGRRLRVGEAVIAVMGETEPCSRMDEVALGMRVALARQGRGGVHGMVERGGTIRIGDPVFLDEPPPGSGSTLSS